MFLFIATIFIAELIIALTLIAYIVKADRAVKNLQKSVIALKPQIQAGLRGVKEGVHLVREKQDLFFKFVRKKRSQYLINTCKAALIYLLLFLFKGRCKKAAAICQGILLAKDVWDNVLA